MDLMSFLVGALAGAVTVIVLLYRYGEKLVEKLESKDTADTDEVVEDYQDDNVPHSYHVEERNGQYYLYDSITSQFCGQASSMNELAELYYERNGTRMIGVVYDTILGKRFCFFDRGRIRE